MDSRTSCWRRCGESAVARDSGSEEKRVREKGGGANLEYSVDMVCGDHEVLRFTGPTNRVNGRVPRSLRRNYGVKRRVRETRVESESKCILTLHRSMIEMRVEE